MSIGSAWKAVGDKAPATKAAAEEDSEDVCPLDGTPFTMYYGQLQHQQNMLQDSVRTGMYQYAFRQNSCDFKGATVLDVGTGTGLLAFFAAQAGARKVYAVEHAGPMATLAERLVKGNHMEKVIKVMNCSVEKCDLKEKVDIVVSEPIGFLLVHERMLESFIAARDLYLRPGGLMMPTTSDIVVAPFTDAALWTEQTDKGKFWSNASFYGIDLRPLAQEASSEYMSQAVVGYFDESILISSDRATHTVDFRTVTLPMLQTFEIPLVFRITTTSLCHGVGCWFDANFLGSAHHVVLSTAPSSAGTHWYQCRLLLAHPIAVNVSQVIRGSLRFVASSKISYTITMSLTIDGTEITSSNKINLQDQHYHYLQTGAGHTTYDHSAEGAHAQWAEEAASGGGGESQDTSLPKPPDLGASSHVDR